MDWPCLVKVWTCLAFVGLPENPVATKTSLFPSPEECKRKVNYVLDVCDKRKYTSSDKGTRRVGCWATIILGFIFQSPFPACGNLPTFDQSLWLLYIDRLMIENFVRQRWLLFELPTNRERACLICTRPNLLLIFKLSCNVRHFRWIGTPWYPRLNLYTKHETTSYAYFYFKS